MGKNHKSFKPGEKQPGAGRPKGSLNKKTVAFQQMLEANNFDPGEAYLRLYEKQLGLYRKAMKKKAVGAAAQILHNASMSLNNICQYIYPRRKAIDHTFKEKPLETLTDQELEQKLKEAEEKLRGANAV